VVQSFTISCVEKLPEKAKEHPQANHPGNFSYSSGFFQESLI